MLASILQMTGAILLGYFIAFRSKKEIKKSVGTVLQVAGQKVTKSLSAYIDTYAYRIGFGFIVLGYLIQIVEYEVEFFTTLEYYWKLIISMSLTLNLTLLSKFVAEKLGKRAYEKSGVYNPNEDASVGEVVLFTNE